MSIDLAQFLPVFYQEAREHLDAIEAGLRAIDDGGTAGAEAAEALFRSAHTIKGAAATFDLQELAAFARALEAFFERVRAGDARLDAEGVDLARRSAALLRDMLAERQGGTAVDAARIARFEAELARPREPAAFAPAAGAAGFCEHVLELGWTVPPDVGLGRADIERLLDSLDQFGQLELLARPPAGAAAGVWRAHLSTAVGEDEVRKLMGFVLVPGSFSVTTLDGGAAAASDATGTAVAWPVVVAPPPSFAGGAGELRRLLTLVGQFANAQAAVAAAARNAEAGGLRRALEWLDCSSRELQEAAMGVATVPAGKLLVRYRHVVESLSAGLGKPVELTLAGESTPLERGLAEDIVEPLDELVQEAVRHALRQVRLAASLRNARTLIELCDDRPRPDEGEGVAGAHPVHAAPPLPDRARRAIQALGGTLSAGWSPNGQGACVAISLPLPLALIDGFAVRAGEQCFVVPVRYVADVLPDGGRGTPEAGEGRVRVHGEVLPALRLAELFTVVASDGAAEPAALLVLEAGRRRAALIADELLGREATVARDVEAHYRPLAGVSGATIRSDGRVALILDVDALMDRLLPDVDDRVDVEDDLAGEGARQAFPQDYLAFGLDGRLYAIDVSLVREIRALDPLTPLAGAPACVRGLIASQDAIVPVVDLRIGLGLPFAGAARFEMVIVLALGTRLVGIVADDVGDVLALAPRPLPREAASAAAIERRFLVGAVRRDGRTIFVLDIEGLMNSEALQISLPPLSERRGG